MSDGFDNLKKREEAMRELAKAINRDRKPEFGDRILNPWAAERNPQRTGMFVKEYRRTGRFNPGRFWQMTDGRGSFWSCWADCLMFADHLTGNEVFP